MPIEKDLLVEMHVNDYFFNKVRGFLQEESPSIVKLQIKRLIGLETDIEIPMDDTQADSVKMNQEVETTQLNQFARDTSISHLISGIKEEPDNETKHDIHSQLPFLAERIKQELICIKCEEITSFEDLYMKVRKVANFDETVTELEKIEQPDLCGEDVGGHIKNERNASTWSYFTDAHADVEKMNSSDIGQRSQLLGHDTVSENLTEVIRKTKKNTGDVGKSLERLLVYMKQIVKNTGDVVDDFEGPPEHINFEKNTGDEAGSFEMLQVHTENTIVKSENKSGDLGLTSTSSERKLNESVKVRECRIILEDIMANNIQNENSLSLNNGENRKLSDNTFCVSKNGAKHNVSSDGSDKLFRYNFCGVGFITFGSLSIYKMMHAGKKTYKCGVCGKCFISNSKLNAHKRAHTGEKPYQCGVCGKSFAHNSGFIAHKRMHTGETPYQCDVCGKDFAHNSRLIAHKRKHTGEKPYKCDVCSKHFAYNRGFIAHKRIHTGETFYKCDVCGKGFAQNSRLMAHKRKHTGEKPYKCDVCAKRFAYNSGFIAHKRIHTGDTSYKCDVCGKGFNRNGNLKIHKRIHTGEKPYKCDVCGNSFNSSSKLNRHKIVHTNSHYVM